MDGQQSNYDRKTGEVQSHIQKAGCQQVMSSGCPCLLSAQGSLLPSLVSSRPAAGVPSFWRCAKERNRPTNPCPPTKTPCRGQIRLSQRQTPDIIPRSHSCKCLEQLPQHEDTDCLMQGTLDYVTFSQAFSALNCAAECITVRLI
jgi:hypothetical protein